MRILCLCLIGIVAALPLLASERDYQHDLCMGMRQEVRLPDGSRADCIGATQTIEVEFSENWAEALGLVLSYAGSAGLRPGIFLLCREKPRKCLAHRLRLEKTIAAWKLPMDVWAYDEQCGALHRAICARRRRHGALPRGGAVGYRDGFLMAGAVAGL